MNLWHFGRAKDWLEHFVVKHPVVWQDEEVTKGMAYLFAEMGESYVDLIASGTYTKFLQTPFLSSHFGLQNASTFTVSNIG